jgi:hypothetical protein
MGLEKLEKIEKVNITMALRARPAKQLSSVLWQYMWGHSVIPSFKVVGGVVSRYIGQPGVW